MSESIKHRILSKYKVYADAFNNYRLAIDIILKDNNHLLLFW